MGKYIKHAELRNITDSYANDEISYSRMVELINEAVDRNISEENEFKVYGGYCKTCGHKSCMCYRTFGHFK